MLPMAYFTKWTIKRINQVKIEVFLSIGKAKKSLMVYDFSSSLF